MASVRLKYPDFAAYPGRLKRELKKAMRVVGKEAGKIAAKEVGAAATRASSYRFNTGRKPGWLERSWRAGQVSVGPKSVNVAVVSNAPYARIQDEGGIIKPKRGTFLAQPLTARARRKWPRQWPKGSLKLVVLKSGKSVLALSRSKRLRPQYLLRKQTVIRPKHYIEKGMRKAQRRIGPMISEAAARAEKVAATKLPKKVT